jgi:hypothetical protein
MPFTDDELATLIGESIDPRCLPAVTVQPAARHRPGRYLAAASAAACVGALAAALTGLGDSHGTRTAAATSGSRPILLSAAGATVPDAHCGQVSVPVGVHASGQVGQRIRFTTTLPASTAPVHIARYRLVVLRPVTTPIGQPLPRTGALQIPSAGSGSLRIPPPADPVAGQVAETVVAGSQLAAGAPVSVSFVADQPGEYRVMTFVEQSAAAPGCPADDVWVAVGAGSVTVG